jgi:hypothetical protein
MSDCMFVNFLYSIICVQISEDQNISYETVILNVV